MTKYYYNGKLIRTSKTNSNYTHAVIEEYKGEIKVLACRSSKQNAQNEYNRIWNDRYGIRIENLKNKIDAMRNGRNYYWHKIGRRVYKTDIKNASLEEEINRLENIRKWAKDFMDYAYVVEIEARQE